MQLKQVIGRAIFFTWALIFLGYYVLGAQGVLYGWRVMAENNVLQQQITELQAHISQLHAEIALWQHEPFVKEAFAREQLQLARPDDIVYYFS